MTDNNSRSPWLAKADGRNFTAQEIRVVDNAAIHVSALCSVPTETFRHSLSGLNRVEQQLLPEALYTYAMAGNTQSSWEEFFACASRMSSTIQKIQALVFDDSLPKEEKISALDTQAAIRASLRNLSR